MADLEDNLKAEYSIIQGQYEAFDARALSIKALATPLLAGGVAVGLKEGSIAILLAVVLASVCLWWLEGIWKMFQYSYIPRIRLLERYFRGELKETELKEIRPFQIFKSWIAEWTVMKHDGKAFPRLLSRPFVFLPYLPICLAAALACVWVHYHPVGKPMENLWKNAEMRNTLVNQARLPT